MFGINLQMKQFLVELTKLHKTDWIWETHKHFFSCRFRTDFQTVLIQMNLFRSVGESCVKFSWEIPSHVLRHNCSN